MTAAPASAEGTTGARRALGALLVPAVSLAIFAALALPPLIQRSGGYDFDESQYYVPAVRQIAAHWPTLDIADFFMSATAPGYQWLVAGLSSMFGSDLVTLRLMNFAVSGAFLAMLLSWLGTRRTAAETASLILPLVASSYFIKSSSWLANDNATLALATFSLLLTITPVKRPRNATVAGGLAALATFSRQSYAWLILLLVTRAWVGRRHALRWEIKWLFAASLPLLCLVVLVLVWGGLLPAQWRTQDQLQHVSTAALAYQLSLAGWFGIFYIRPSLERPAAAGLPLYILAALAGLGAALATATSADHGAGRWGGYLWEVAQRLPAVADRSLLFIVMAPLGAIVLTAFYRAIRQHAGREAAFLWGISVIAWLIAFVPVRQVFQRYFEPMTLVFLIVAVALTGRRPFNRTGCWLLAAIQAVMTLATVWAAAVFHVRVM